MKPNNTAHTAPIESVALIPAAALLARPDTGVLDANAEAMELLGVPRPLDEDPCTLDRLFSEALGQVNHEAIRQIALSASGAEAACERLIRIDGPAPRERLVRLRGCWMAEAGVALVLLDERPDNTALHETLAQSELLYDTFLRQAPTGIVHLDAAGNVTFENLQVREIFGDREAERWMTMRVLDLDGLAPQARGALKDLVEEVDIMLTA